jgi:hypothetical protein
MDDVDAAVRRLVRGSFSILIRKRMVFVGYDPTTAFLAQPDGQAQAVVRVSVELLLGSAAQQCVREGDIVARRDVERDDLE